MVITVAAPSDSARTLPWIRRTDRVGVPSGHGQPPGVEVVIL